MTATSNRSYIQDADIDQIGVADPVAEDATVRHEPAIAATEDHRM
jgi:hypothetical protein